MFRRQPSAVQALFPTSSPDQLSLRYSDSVLCKYPRKAESSQAQTWRQSAGRRLSEKVSNVNFEEHWRGLGKQLPQQHLHVNFQDHRRGLGSRKCFSRERKGSKARIEGVGRRVECRSALKEGESLLKPSTLQSTTNKMESKSLWSKLTQSVNILGVCFSGRVISRDRHLAIPHVNVPDISWVDWKALRVRGFEGVLFDKDNTLTAPYGQNIWPSLNESLEECRTVFEGRIALLSNSAGLYQYDPLGTEAKAVELRLGIPVVRHGQKKPAGNALAVSNYFGCDPSRLIMVGDRYFTDVVYGNNNGLLTIRPAPLTILGEPLIVRQVRVIEEALVDSWRRQGVLPTKHELFENPKEFIKDPGCW